MDGPSGREVIQRFSLQVGRVLSEQGRILLLVSNLTGQEEVERIFGEQGMTGRIIKELPLEGEKLFVYRFSGSRCR
jgi:hypothetical protein